MSKRGSSEDKTVVKPTFIKEMRIVKKLGEGGTGRTLLLQDEAIGQLFAVKKYAPLDEGRRDELYDRFVDEIKILFLIYHPNIVRIFDYYLYPKYKSGYIQMEYIEGNTIDKINPVDYDKEWNDYFVDAINAFQYLHSKNIMHRDIRPQNFMVNNEGSLKIIDFGFGKHTENSKTINSVLLNWPASKPPEEIVNDRNYNKSTEIYFLGNLFKHLIDDNSTFLYCDILDKMNEQSVLLRYNSFDEIIEDISKITIYNSDFSEKEKKDI